MQLTQGQNHCVDTCFALNERTASLVSMATVRGTPRLKNSLSSIKMSRDTRSLSVLLNNPRKTVNNVIININEASTLQQLGVQHINKTYENMTM